MRRSSTSGHLGTRLPPRRTRRRYRGPPALLPTTSQPSRSALTRIRSATQVHRPQFVEQRNHFVEQRVKTKPARRRIAEPCTPRLGCADQQRRQGSLRGGSRLLAVTAASTTSPPIPPRSAGQARPAGSCGPLAVRATRRSSNPPRRSKQASVCRSGPQRVDLAPLPLPCPARPARPPSDPAGLQSWRRTATRHVGFWRRTPPVCATMSDPSSGGAGPWSP